MSTEMNQLVADYNARCLKLKEEAHARMKTNRSRISKALKRLGATHVVVSYSGSGDSGQIDEVEIRKGDSTLEPTKSALSLCSTSKWDSENSRWIENMKTKRKPLKEALEDFAYDWIESEYAGWENNDGASGEFTINVASDEFRLSHTYYYTEHETLEHSL